VPKDLNIRWRYSSLLLLVRYGTVLLNPVNSSRKGDPSYTFPTSRTWT
jgi:hypothetical protein